MFRAEQMLTLERARSGWKETASKRRLVNESELELRDAVLIESAGPGKRDERWLGTIKRRGLGRDRRAGGPGAAGTGRRRPGPRPESVPGSAADDLGAARRKPGRAPPGRLGRRADRRPGDRAGDRPPARVHRGPGPSAQRPPAQPRRPALQPAGRGSRRGRRAQCSTEQIETAGPRPGSAASRHAPAGVDSRRQPGVPPAK